MVILVNFKVQNSIANTPDGTHTVSAAHVAAELATIVEGDETSVERIELARTPIAFFIKFIWNDFMGKLKLFC